MKKFVIAAAFALAATNLTAGSLDKPEMEEMAEPMMEPEMVDESSSGINTNTLLILLALAGAALVVAN